MSLGDKSTAGRPDREHTNQVKSPWPQILVGLSSAVIGASVGILLASLFGILDAYLIGLLISLGVTWAVLLVSPRDFARKAALYLLAFSVAAIAVAVAVGSLSSAYGGVLVGFLINGLNFTVFFRHKKTDPEDSSAS